MLAPAGLVVRKPLAWADAIVVMAGSEAYEERATVAASLFREGRAPVIVLTDEGTRAGWSEAEQRNPSFAELTVVTLVRKGVTSDAIVTLPVPPPQHSTRTVDEALQVVSWSRRQGSYNLLVVTSGCHTRRTLAAFDAADLHGRVGIVPAPDVCDTRGVSLYGLGTVLIEYVKLGVQHVSATWS